MSHKVMFRKIAGTDLCSALRKNCQEEEDVMEKWGPNMEVEKIVRFQKEKGQWEVQKKDLDPFHMPPKIKDSYIHQKKHHLQK